MTTVPAAPSGAVTPPDPAPSSTANSIKQAGKATAMMIGFVLLSRVLGVVRDIVLAQFGQNEITTIYRGAFRVPDILYLLVAGGAIAPVFVPVFAEYWHTDRKAEAWKVFSAVTSITAVVALLLVILMEIFAVPFTRLIFPAFSDAGVQKTAYLSRILLPAQWCFFVGGLLMGVLNARKRFLIPAIGPVVYNAGIIAGGLIGVRWYHDRPETGIALMAGGAVVGAVCGNFLLPAWELWRSGGEFHVDFDFRHPGVRKIGRLMLPAILGLSLSQLTFWITQSFLGDDWRISALGNAYNLTQAPIGVFAQASAIVLFPTIAMLAAQENWGQFREEVSQGIRRILFLTVPASVLMAVLAEPLIALIFANKRFGPDAVHAAAAALWCYSAATFAWSAQAVLARGFYSIQDTKTPVIITTSMVFLFTGLCFAFRAIFYSFGMGQFDYLALALAASVVASINMVIFLFTLQKKVGGLNLGGIVSSAVRVTISATAGGAAAYFLMMALNRLSHEGRLMNAVILIVAGGAGILVYALSCYLLRVPEMRTIREMFRRKKTV
jgi:putative peptidoglycan lipid II flippase